MVFVSAVLLGAGRSERMGGDKLSLAWGKRTLLEHCLQTLLRSRVREVIVVLNNRTKETQHRLQGRKTKVVINPYFKKGMSSSIRSGVLAIDPISDGVLIALGDQPFLKTRTVNALIHAFESSKRSIVVPSFKGQKGHPVLFHRKFEKELMSLEGDVGGKAVIEKHPEEVFLLDTKSEGVVRDIDTCEDYTSSPFGPSRAMGKREGGGKSEESRWGKEK